MDHFPVESSDETSLSASIFTVDLWDLQAEDPVKPGLES